MKTKVTIWETHFPKTQDFRFNHIEDGWSSETTPTPRSAWQAKVWKNRKWRKKYAYLNLEDGKVNEV